MRGDVKALPHDPRAQGAKRRLLHGHVVKQLLIALRAADDLLKVAHQKLFSADLIERLAGSLACHRLLGERAPDRLHHRSCPIVIARLNTRGHGVTIEPDESRGMDAQRLSRAPLRWGVAVDDGLEVVGAVRVSLDPRAASLTRAGELKAIHDHEALDATHCGHGRGLVFLGVSDHPDGGASIVAGFGARLKQDRCPVQLIEQRCDLLNLIEAANGEVCDGIAGQPVCHCHRQGVLLEHVELCQLEVSAWRHLDASVAAAARAQLRDDVLEAVES